MSLDELAQTLNLTPDEVYLIYSQISIALAQLENMSVSDIQANVIPHPRLPIYLRIIPEYIRGSIQEVNALLEAVTTENARLQQEIARYRRLLGQCHPLISHLNLNGIRQRTREYIRQKRIEYGIQNNTETQRRKIKLSSEKTKYEKDIIMSREQAQVMSNRRALISELTDLIAQDEEREQQHQIQKDTLLAIKYQQEELACQARLVRSQTTSEATSIRSQPTANQQQALGSSSMESSFNSLSLHYRNEPIDSEDISDPAQDGDDSLDDDPYASDVDENGNIKDLVDDDEKKEP